MGRNRKLAHYALDVGFELPTFLLKDGGLQWLFIPGYLILVARRPQNNTLVLDFSN